MLCFSTSTTAGRCSDLPLDLHQEVLRLDVMTLRGLDLGSSSPAAEDTQADGQ